MREEDDQASVRIEIDAAGDAPTTVPEAAPASSSRLPLIVGLVALVVVGVLVLVALPDQEDGFVGGAEATADSVPESPTTTDLPRGDVELRITGEELDLPPTPTTEPWALRDTNLGSEVQSVAPAERGWIALRPPSGGVGPPRLMRSIDGTDWTFIDTSLDLQGLDAMHVEYSHLTASDTGFAMLMMSFGERPTGTNGETVVLHRLVSEFGAEWEIDADFSPWKGTGVAQPIAHAGDWVQMVLLRDPTPGASSLGQMLRSNVIDPDVLGDACWAYRSGATQLTVENCAGPDGSVQLAPEDFLEPERFDEVVACVDDLMDGGAAPGLFEFAAIGSDGRVRQIDDVGLLVSFPALLPDGTVALVDGGRELFDSGACRDLVDIELRAGSRLVVWPAGAEQASTIPVELEEMPELSYVGIGAVATVPEGLRMLIGGEVWEANLANATMDVLIEVPQGGAGFSQEIGVLTPDGGRVVSFVPGAEIAVFDLATQERLVLVDDLGSVDWLEPLLVTNDEILLRVFGVQSRTVWVDLRPQ